MDIQAYISSGIIEAYVLGLASNEEVREVEGYATQYAEVRQAITDFEIGLEKQALENAIAPPAFLKEKIMASIKEEKSATGATSISQNKEQPQGAKVIPITPAPKSIRWLRGAVAASVILLLGSAILNFYYYSQYKKYNKQYDDLLVSQGTMTAKIDAYRASFNAITDTSVIKVNMPAANEQRAGSVATVFWNKQTKNVFLTVNNLPAPAAGKQYQLWAIVDGKPVDAGMVNTNVIGNKDQPSAMKQITGAQAFAITLEDEGGSPTPHLEQLYVLGKV